MTCLVTAWGVKPLILTTRCHASAVYVIVVCLSVTSRLVGVQRPFSAHIRLNQRRATSRCSTETAKCRTTQTTPHDRPGTLAFWCQKSLQNSNRVTPKITDLRQITRYNSKMSTVASTVNLVWSQVYHSERPPHLFAARLQWCSASHRFINEPR